MSLESLVTGLHSCQAADPFHANFNTKWFYTPMFLNRFEATGKRSPSEVVDMYVRPQTLYGSALFKMWHLFIWFDSAEIFSSQPHTYTLNLNFLTTSLVWPMLTKKTTTSSSYQTHIYGIFVKIHISSKRDWDEQWVHAQTCAHKCSVECWWIADISGCFWAALSGDGGKTRRQTRAEEWNCATNYFSPVLLKTPSLNPSNHQADRFLNLSLPVLLSPSHSSDN